MNMVFLRCESALDSTISLLVFFMFEEDIAQNDGEGYFLGVEKFGFHMVSMKREKRCL